MLALTFRFLVGRVARFNVSPLFNGPISVSVSAFINVKLATCCPSTVVLDTCRSAGEVALAPPIEAMK